MRPSDIALSRQIENKLSTYNRDVQSLPGIHVRRNLTCLVAQIIDSIRRIKYVETIRDKQQTRIYCDANSHLFDPLRAAAWYRQNGDFDEALWLVFLATHFGKNKRTGWTLAREIYQGAGIPHFWEWEHISINFRDFRNWLVRNQQRIKLIGNFGNHRKYQSLDAYSATGTGMAIGSYIEWVGATHNHADLINRSIEEVGDNPRELFQYLYQSMNNVVSFGRTARFDYLTMAGKLDLLPIEPGSTYMQGATGPKAGAKLLFGGSITANLTEHQLSEFLINLEEHLGLFYGMQVLEDSLCNWQKSPGDYIHFVG